VPSLRSGCRSLPPLWIEYDIIGNAKLKKAPEFYE